MWIIHKLLAKGNRFEYFWHESVKIDYGNLFGKISAKSCHGKCKSIVSSEIHSFVKIYESNSNYVLLKIWLTVLIFCSKKHDVQFARQSFTHAWSIEVSIKNEWPLIESLLMYFMSCATFDFWCKNSVKAKS